MIRTQRSNPLAGIIVIMFLVGMIWLAITALKGIFAILSWMALPLFVSALILNHNVVIEYFKWLIGLLKNDTIKGVIYSGLTVLAYPLVSAYLAFKALNNNRWTNPKAQGEETKGEYLTFQEVEDVSDEEDFLHLPTLEESAEPESNKYDDMF